MIKEENEELCRSLYLIANAISSVDAIRGEDAAGGRVGCLTEAGMGITAGLVRIANAVEELAIATERVAEALNK